MSDRARYQRRRATTPPINNNVRRAYDLLRATLVSLEPDTLLVEHELVEALAASRNTVRIVLQLLAAEGLVCRGPKIGTHVGTGVVMRVDELRPLADVDRRRSIHRQPSETSVIAAPRLVAARLELPAGSRVRISEGVIFEGTTPVGLAVSYIALSDSPASTDYHDTPDTIRYIEEALNIPIWRADTVVVALAADAQTSAVLGIPEGAPILFLEDLLRDSDNRPRALSQFRFRSDRVTFSATAWRNRGEPLPTRSQMEP